MNFNSQFSIIGSASFHGNGSRTRNFGYFLSLHTAQGTTTPVVELECKALLVPSLTFLINVLELALIQYVRLNRNLSFDDNTEYWNSKHILIQEIYSALQHETSFSIGGLHEILQTVVSDFLRIKFNLI